MSEVIAAPRLPLPPGAPVDAQQWRVLTEAIWPGARTAGAVMLALDYCRARKLDPFRRPVHIVPVWNSALGREVETVWPGINELQTTASRTGLWAGLDPPTWGPLRRRRFTGRVGRRGEERETTVEVEYPEWCSVTVYKLIGGQARSYCEPVWWEESYARIGRTQVPNDMWARRPRGQLLKVAKAASLRAAFPEESEGPTAEEMEGQAVDAGGLTIDAEPPAALEPARPAEPPPQSPTPSGAKGMTWAEVLSGITQEVELAETTEQLAALQHSERLTRLRAAAAGQALERIAAIDSRINYRLAALAVAEAEPDPVPDDAPWPGPAP